MSIRALIIAIESYPLLNDQAPGNLEGTIETARAFRHWLIEKKKTSEKNILFCSHPAVKNETTHEATREGIKAAVIALLEAGADRTEELYFTFSGHGYAQTSYAGEVTANGLMSSDYRNSTHTGDHCLKLEEIISLLRTRMGPGEHYYFIDACRVARNEELFKAGSLAIGWQRSQKAEPSDYVLFSTSTGEIASASQKFGKALLDGLEGRGRAKQWLTDGSTPPRLVVRFGSLASFVKKRMTPQRPQLSGSRSEEGLIFEVPHPWEVACEIEIIGAAPDETFELSIYDDLNQKQNASQRFKGSSLKVNLIPRDYYVNVSSTDVTPPYDPILLDFFEGRKVRFRKKPGTTEVRYVTPAEEAPFETIEGPYEMRNVELRSAVCESSFNVERTSLQQELSHLVADLRDPLPRIGALESEDLEKAPTLALSLMGVGRILEATQSDTLPTVVQRLGKKLIYSEIRPGRNGSMIHVIVGLLQPNARLSLRIGVEAGEWSPISRINGCHHISAYASTIQPGSHLISIAFDDQSVITLATSCLPNRGTLITVAPDEYGALQIQQMMLPLGHLISELPDEVQTQLHLTAKSLTGERGERLVEFIVDSQQMFRNRTELTKLSEEWLHKLLYAKWFDPVMAVLACYELLRRGRREDIDEAMSNLNRYFVDLPDVQALRRLAGIECGTDIGLPIFLDGIGATEQDDGKLALPLPADKLDYGGMWMLWRGAVTPPLA